MLDTTNHGRHGTWKTALIAAFTLAAALGETPTPPRAAPVSLYLNVEKSGGLVTGLTQGNFRLYLDGKAQPFRLERPEEPASIALLVEYSGSSRYFLEDLNASMQGFLRHAAEGPWYALATFSRELEVHTDFTKETGQITAAWAAVGTPFRNEINTYDAVYDMLDKMGRLPGRRILIVIGCGVDSFSEHTMDEVRKKAESENVTIFAAGLGSLFRGSYEPYLSSSARMSFAQARAFLQMLAEKTGGFAWFPNLAPAYPDVMEGIMQSIATQYRLVYDPPVRSAGKLQKIKVEAFRIVDDKRENFQVLVREGWR
ncbi:MAG TPA: VWA domain-containing protein [Bryobacteraceae bacterium]|nr:VWA domain-containing protein [Bryobacteraceae bacterium]